MYIENIEEKVRAIICSVSGYPASSIKSDVNFMNEFGADELEIWEMIMALEEEFSINYDDDDLGDMMTFDEIVDWVDTETSKI